MCQNTHLESFRFRLACEADSLRSSRSPFRGISSNGHDRSSLSLWLTAVRWEVVRFLEEEGADSGDGVFRWWRLCCCCCWWRGGGEVDGVRRLLLLVLCLWLLSSRSDRWLESVVDFQWPPPPLPPPVTALEARPRSDGLSLLSLDLVSITMRNAQRTSTVILETWRMKNSKNTMKNEFKRKNLNEKNVIKCGHRFGLNSKRARLMCQKIWVKNCLTLNTNLIMYHQ